MKILGFGIVLLIVLISSMSLGLEMDYNQPNTNLNLPNNQNEKASSKEKSGRNQKPKIEEKNSVSKPFGESLVYIKENFRTIICRVLYRETILIFWNERVVYAYLSDNPILKFYVNDPSTPPSRLFNFFGLRMFPINSPSNNQFFDLLLDTNLKSGNLIQDGVYFELLDCKAPNE
jgi:hypothetical protein